MACPDLVRLGRRFVLAIGFAGLVSVTLSSHYESVHRVITNKAVDYLVDDRYKFHPELIPCVATLKQFIGIGVDQEDRTFNDLGVIPVLGLPWPIGRFFFHFLPPLHDELGTSATSRADATCDSVDWGFGGGPCIGTLKIGPIGPLEYQIEKGSTNRSNESTYASVVADLKNHPPGSVLHNPTLIDLGEFLHLLQDLTSPPHTHNDGHPHLDRHWTVDGLGDPSNFEVFNRNVKEADIAFPSAGTLLTWDQPEDAFRDLQRFTSSRFWSEKSIGGTDGPVAQTVTPDGYAVDNEGRRLARRMARTSALTINDTVARAQFAELAPVAVLYTASMISHLIKKEGVTLCSVAQPARAGYTNEANDGVSGLHDIVFPNGPVPLTLSDVIDPRAAAAGSASADSSGSINQNIITLTASGSGGKSASGRGGIGIEFEDVLTVSGPPGVPFSLRLRAPMAASLTGSGPLPDRRGYGVSHATSSGCVTKIGPPAVTIAPWTHCTEEDQYGGLAPPPPSRPLGQPLEIGGFSGSQVTIKWTAYLEALGTGSSNAAYSDSASSSGSTTTTFLITELSPGFTVSSSLGLRYGR